MTTYVGERYPAGARVVIRMQVDDREHRDYNLPPRHDLFNHSPDGFEWGYQGSGPAQLALAICADALGDDERALRVYQEFKCRAIAPIKTDDWLMEKQYVLDIVREIEAEQAYIARACGAA